MKFPNNQCSLVVIALVALGFHSVSSQTSDVPSKQAISAPQKTQVVKPQAAVSDQSLSLMRLPVIGSANPKNQLEKEDSKSASASTDLQTAAGEHGKHKYMLVKKKPKKKKHKKIKIKSYEKKYKIKHKKVKGKLQKRTLCFEF